MPSSSEISGPEKRSCLHRGLLELACEAARECEHLDLEDSLQLCLLMQQEHDERFERAAVRWLGRLFVEHPEIGLDLALQAMRGTRDLAGGARDVGRPSSRSCSVRPVRSGPRSYSNGEAPLTHRKLARVQTARAFIGRIVRAVRLLARDRRIPKPLRWLAGLGLLPIPGPFDEAVLVLIAPVFLIFYREPLRDAWTRAQPLL
jgi:hypothetical protein